MEEKIHISSSFRFFDHLAAATGSISAQPATIPCKACVRAFDGRVRAHSAAASGVAGATGSACVTGAKTEKATTATPWNKLLPKIT
jgi:hypothetical protein